MMKGILEGNENVLMRAPRRCVFLFACRDFVTRGKDSPKSTYCVLFVCCMCCVFQVHYSIGTSTSAHGIVFLLTPIMPTMSYKHLRICIGVYRFRFGTAQEKISRCPLAPSGIKRIQEANPCPESSTLVKK